MVGLAWGREKEAKITPSIWACPYDTQHNHINKCANVSHLSCVNILPPATHHPPYTQSPACQSPLRTHVWATCTLIFWPKKLPVTFFADSSHKGRQACSAVTGSRLIITPCSDLNALIFKAIMGVMTETRACTRQVFGWVSNECYTCWQKNRIFPPGVKYSQKY